MSSRNTLRPIVNYVHNFWAVLEYIVRAWSFNAYLYYQSYTMINRSVKTTSMEKENLVQAKHSYPVRAFLCPLLVYYYSPCNWLMSICSVMWSCVEYLENVICFDGPVAFHNAPLVERMVKWSALPGIFLLYAKFCNIDVLLFVYVCDIIHVFHIYFRF